jgi:hypothetical protein
VSPFLASVLALILVISPALIFVFYGLYVVVTAIQVALITIYITLLYLIVIFVVILILVLAFILCYTLVVTTLTIVHTVSLVVNTLLALLVVILFDIFNISPEAPVNTVRAFPSSPPSLSCAVTGGRGGLTWQGHCEFVESF